MIIHIEVNTSALISDFFAIQARLRHGIVVCLPY